MIISPVEIEKKRKIWLNFCVVELFKRDCKSTRSNFSGIKPPIRVFLAAPEAFEVLSKIGTNMLGDSHM